MCRSPIMFSTIPRVHVCCIFPKVKILKAKFTHYRFRFFHHPPMQSPVLFLRLYNCKKSFSLSFLRNRSHTLFRKVGYYRPTRCSCFERALSKRVSLSSSLSLALACYPLHPLLGSLLPSPPPSFFFIIGQRSTSKWFFGALRFHDDGAEQCAGLIPTACSFARNRGKGKIVASPPGDSLRRGKSASQMG